ncbi:MAG: hypothetical protein Fur0022_27790 [Anaerolineales bacterium]
MKNILYWTPRVLTILFTAFLALFSLDVFGEGYTFWETLVALFMHLIPQFLLIILLVIAWRWERVGGLLFIGLGLVFLVWFGGWDMLTGNATGFRAENWFGGLLVPAFVAMLGLLFLTDQLYRRKHLIQS